MIKLKEIVDAIEQFAPLHYQEHYDNSGLLVGEMDDDIHSAILCVDVLEDTICEAIESGCNLIISHHPLVFSGIKQFSKSNYINRVLHLAIKHNIAIYCSHTSLDSAFGGVSYRTAQALGLSSLETLNPVNQPQNNVGLGVVGELENPMQVEEFIAFVASALNCKAIRYSKSDARIIKKVALCGGSASELYPKALEHNADIYLTADVKYHAFFVEPKDPIIADIGHFESEKYAIDIFYDIISEKFPTFAVRMSLKDRNPIRYFIAD